MGRLVIACYKPKAGKEEALRALVAGHVTALRSIGLATDRAPIAMQAGDGTIIEVFEWASAEAIRAAHAHPLVLQMWEQFSRVCDYVPVGSLSESSNLFADYTPVAVDGT